MLKAKIVTGPLSATLVRPSVVRFSTRLIQAPWVESRAPKHGGDPFTAGLLTLGAPQRAPPPQRTRLLELPDLQVYRPQAEGQAVADEQGPPPPKDKAKKGGPAEPGPPPPKDKSKQRNLYKPKQKNKPPQRRSERQNPTPIPDDRPPRPKGAAPIPPKASHTRHSTPKPKPKPDAAFRKRYQGPPAPGDKIKGRSPADDAPKPKNVEPPAKRRARAGHVQTGNVEEVRQKYTKKTAPLPERRKAKVGEVKTGNVEEVRQKYTKKTAPLPEKRKAKVGEVKTGNVEEVHQRYAQKTAPIPEKKAQPPKKRNGIPINKARKVSNKTSAKPKPSRSSYFSQNFAEPKPQPQPVLPEKPAAQEDIFRQGEGKRPAPTPEKVRKPFWERKEYAKPKPEEAPTPRNIPRRPTLGDQVIERAERINRTKAAQDAKLATLRKAKAQLNTIVEPQVEPNPVAGWTEHIAPGEEPEKVRERDAPDRAEKRLTEAKRALKRIHDQAREEVERRRPKPRATSEDIDPRYKKQEEEEEAEQPRGRQPVQQLSLGEAPSEPLNRKRKTVEPEEATSKPGPPPPRPPKKVRGEPLRDEQREATDAVGEEEAEKQRQEDEVQEELTSAQRQGRRKRKRDQRSKRKTDESVASERDKDSQVEEEAKLLADVERLYKQQLQDEGIAEHEDEAGKEKEDNRVHDERERASSDRVRKIKEFLASLEPPKDSELPSGEEDVGRWLADNTKLPKTRRIGGHTPEQKKQAAEEAVEKLADLYRRKYGPERAKQFLAKASKAKAAAVKQIHVEYDRKNAKRAKVRPDAPKERKRGTSLGERLPEYHRQFKRANPSAEEQTTGAEKSRGKKRAK